VSYLIITEDFKTAVHNIVTGPILGYHSGNIKNIPAVTFLQYIATQKVWSRLLSKTKIGEKILAIAANIGVNTGTGITPGIAILLAPLFAGYASIISSVFGGKDIVDRIYFEHHWDIYDLYPQIAKWCKDEGGLLITDDNFDELNDRSFKKIGDTRHEVGNSRSYLANPKKFKDKITTALTCIPIESENGFYYVYPIFDTKDIMDMKVLCAKNDLDLYVKSLKNWKKIDHLQFRK